MTPSCLHTTSASDMDHSLSHTVPHLWSRHISTLPENSPPPPTSRTLPSWHVTESKSVGSLNDVHQGF